MPPARATRTVAMQPVPLRRDCRRPKTWRVRRRVSRGVLGRPAGADHNQSTHQLATCRHGLRLTTFSRPCRRSPSRRSATPAAPSCSVKARRRSGVAHSMMTAHHCGGGCAATGRTTLMMSWSCCRMTDPMAPARHLHPRRFVDPCGHDLIVRGIVGRSSSSASGNDARRARRRRPRAPGTPALPNVGQRCSVVSPAPPRGRSAPGTTCPEGVQDRGGSLREVLDGLVVVPRTTVLLRTRRSTPAEASATAPSHPR